MRFDERPVTEAHLEQLWELEREAFDADAAQADFWKRWALDGGAERWHALFDGGRCAAMAKVFPFRQWFGGRSVAMGGVAAVAVRPEYRGHGCARRVLRSCLASMRARGEVISALFPSVVPPYRGLGWEHAGLVTYHRVPTRALAAIRAPDVRIRRGGAADLDVLRACYDGVARASNGFLDRTDARWRWLLDRRSHDLLYLAGDDGYVIYEHRARPEIGPGVFHLAVSQLVAATPEALRALWAMLGAPTSPFIPTVTFRGAPFDPLRLLLPALDVTPVRERYWMLRLVDAAGAIAARGYPAGVRATVPLEQRRGVPREPGTLRPRRRRRPRIARAGRERRHPARRRRAGVALQRVGDDRGPGSGGTPRGRLGCRARAARPRLRRLDALDARRVLTGH